MAILFRLPNGPTRINEAQINQSVLGYPVIAVMGKGKVQQSVIWMDGFVSSLVNTQGGKGLGGAKGGNQYAYSADVICALCDGSGGLLGIGDVWSGQSWLSNTPATETTVITGGVYVPANAAAMTADLGVSIEQSVSGSFSDVGSSTPTVISGTTSAPYQRQPYGTTLASGEYSVNPANNNYYFSTADDGKTVSVNYSFSLTTVKKQVIGLVPSGHTITVGTNTDNQAFSADGGVVYYSGDGTDPYNGIALTKVTGTPTEAGTYSVSLDGATYSSGTPSYESQPATYHFAAGDINQEVLITYEVKDPASVPVGTQTSLSFTLLEGTPLQSPWSLLESSYPDACLGYPGIVLVCYGPMSLGYSAEIQQNSFEVLTADGWGAGIADCSPVQCILQLLTNKVWGLGAGPVVFPASVIDNGASGTWGTPGASATVRQDGTATAWFAANGFFISPVIDRQDTAASLIGKWLEAGQCAVFMSEGLMKLVPYGDTSTSGNGCVWVAPSEFLTALDDTCYLKKGGKGKGSVDPVKISSSPYLDGWTTVRVSWHNPAHQYAPEITQESDQAAINRYGNRIEDPQAWDFITSLPSATFAASMRVKRMVYIRNTYEFSVPYSYIYLECMAVVLISTESVWSQGLNNQNLAIVNLPVRITKIVDNPDGTLDVTAEDYPFGVNEPTIYNKGISIGQTPPNAYSSPGDTQAVVFNAGGRLTAYGANQIWVGASGSGENWGSCNVFASMDGDTYTQLGSVTAASRLGVLDSTLASGSDPDTTNTLVADLILNSLPLESGTTANADAAATLCYVDGECLSYSACACTGVDQYTMGGYLRRGQMGTAIGSHAAGSQFLRLDDTVLKYSPDPSWAGKTIYLKFQSVNSYGNSAQDLSTLTPVEFTVGAAKSGAVVVTGAGAAVVNTSALTDLPDIGSSDGSMTLLLDGRSALVSVNLEFNAVTGSGTAGLISIDFSYFGATEGYGPPSMSISIEGGDGTGAGASVTWSVESGTDNWYIPHLYITPGSGYTVAPSAVITVSNGGSAYTDGTYTATTSISGGGTPVASAPLRLGILMDGAPVLGPVNIVTDAAGNALYTGSTILTPPSGSHTFAVQAYNPDSDNTVLSNNRTFQLIPVS